jgi:hypothetical protein
MHEWIFRAAAVGLAILAYALSVWGLVAACLALAAWYGWHTYTYGHVPGADPQPLDQTTKGDLNAALVAAALAAVPAAVIPVGLFATGLGYPVVFAMLGVAAAVGGFLYWRWR